MYRHFLNFIDLPLIGKIEISEPFKFDGSTHEIKREKGRHSRDIIISNQDIELEFYREHFEPIEVEQVLPDGTIFKYVSHGFDYLVNEINTKGWEMQVEYIIDYNGNEFTTGEIDGLTYKVFDEYLSIKISQNTLKAYIKKNESVKIDTFSDKSLTRLPIEPCQTTDIFLKAKPLRQFSKWRENGTTAFGASIARETVTAIFGANNCNLIESYGIEDTLSFMSPRYQLRNDNLFPVGGDGYTFLSAKNELTNVNIKISNLVASTSQSKTDFFDHVVTSGSGFAELVVLYGFDDGVGNNVEEIVLYRKNFGFSIFTPEEFLPTDFNVTIPLIQQGMRVWIYLRPYSQATFSGPISSIANYTVDVQMTSMTVEITATSTAISTIVKGVRLIDLLRHQAHSYDTTLIDRTVFGNGSEYWNNFAFNGRMLANLTDKPFTNEFKNLFTSVCDEAFADYQITNDGIEIDFIDNFYKDEEIAVFTELPANDFNYTANSDYSINTINLKFKKSSSDRTGNSADTNDDVHTALQLKMPSKKADADLSIEFDHIRSAQLIEEQRRKGNEITDKTRTLENDENLFLLDCVPLAPNTVNEFTQFLRYRILNIPNQLEIVSNGTFVWTNLGMQVGQTISVSFTGLPNGTNFQVLALEDFTIRLQYLNNLPTSDSFGERSITFNYILQGVLFTNRTTQEFTLIEGVANSDNYSNLKFSLKRILNKWNKLINTAGQYLIGKNAEVTEIKVNNELVTRMTGESANVVDFAPIEITEDRILNGRLFTAKVFCDFEKATDLFKETRDLKGYVRVVRNSNEVIRGYLKEARYTWRSQELLLTIEEKKDNFITEITGLEVANYNIVNDFVNLYDVNGLPLVTAKEYRFFSINEIIYENVEDFTENLINLLP
jgi:hypothetical protein